MRRLLHVLAVASLAVAPLAACASGVLDETEGSEAEVTAEGPDAASSDGRPINVDKSVTPDAASEPSNTPDAASDASSIPNPPVDAGAAEVFGTSCASPTVYAESFATNPLGTRWQAIVGNVTHNAGLLVLAAGSPNTQAWIGERSNWNNYTISVPVRIDSSGDSGNGGVTFRMMSVGSANDSGQMYYAGITPTGVVIGAENGTWNHFTAAAGTFNTGTFYTLTVTANGNALSASANGVNAIYTNSNAATTFATGSFGFRTFNMAMTFGAVSVTCN